MAGNYPDVTSWRMAWDVDGTQFGRHGRRQQGTPVQGEGGYVEASSTIRAQQNSEETLSGGLTSGSQAGYAYYWIFPELRDLDGYYLFVGGTGNVNRILVSEDTTNGVDGTWTQIQGSYTTPSMANKEALRNSIIYNTVLGIKGIVVITTGNIASHIPVQNAHWYGEPSPGENLQRLEIWHPTLDQRIGPADLDWGDVPRNSSEIREFRVKNMHETLTAEDVRVAMSILTDTSPSVVGQMAISEDGSNWGAQQTLDTDLGPEEISPILYIRRTTPSNATLSLWWYRLFADCVSWS